MKKRINTNPMSCSSLSLGLTYFSFRYLCFFIVNILPFSALWIYSSSFMVVPKSALLPFNMDVRLEIDTKHLLIYWGGYQIENEGFFIYRLSWVPKVSVACYKSIGIKISDAPTERRAMYSLLVPFCTTILFLRTGYVFPFSKRKPLICSQANRWLKLSNGQLNMFKFLYIYCGQTNSHGSGNGWS
jgi:hypothetical protein